MTTETENYVKASESYYKLPRKYCSIINLIEIHSRTKMKEVLSFISVIDNNNII